MSDFGLVDWRIRQDYRNEDPMVPQFHENKFMKEENSPPLVNNNVGSHEDLSSDWKGIFFMFQDDSIKEEPSKIVVNYDDSNREKIEEDASLGHVTDKGFFFMFDHSSPTIEINVSGDFHPPSFDEEPISPTKNQESWFFPKYDDEPTSCFPDD